MRRFSSQVMANSAVSATMARMNIAANTPLGLKVACAVAITSPIPWIAPRYSPTTAPTSEKPKLVCRLARIHDSAEGKITWVDSWRSLAPRMHAVDLTHALEGVEEDDEEHEHDRQGDLGPDPVPDRDDEDRTEHHTGHRVECLDVRREHVGQQADAAESDTEDDAEGDTDEEPKRGLLERRRHL